MIIVNHFLKENSYKSNEMFAVTGATGLVGSNMLYLLVSKGLKVKALYHTQNKIEQVRLFFTRIDKENAVKHWNLIHWVKADIQDYADLTEAFTDVEVVFHTAALVSFRKADRANMKQINWQGTNNVVNACLETNVSYLNYVSSVAALDGVKVDGKEVEALSNAKLKDKFYYGKTKFDAEKEVYRGVAEGLMASVVNPTIILGYSTSKQSSASLFHAVLKGMPFYTNGATDFVDVRDVVEIMWKLYEKRISGERFILSGGEMTYKKLFSQIALKLNKKVPKFNIPYFWAVFFAFWAELFFPKSTNITISSIKSAYKTSFHSNDKVRQQLGFTFISPQESINYFSKFYQLNNTKI